MESVKLLTWLLLLLIAALQSHAFSWPHWGRCPDLPVQQDLKLSSYQSYWYEIAGYNLKAVEGDTRCNYAYYVLDTNKIFNVNNYGINDSNNQTVYINGTAEFADPTKQEGKLIVTLHNGPYTITAPYWVLDTDYKTYSVVYSCKNFFFFFHYYYVWLLSRDRSMSIDKEQAFYNTTYAALARVGIPTSLIRTSVNSDCYPYL